MVCELNKGRRWYECASVWWQDSVNACGNSVLIAGRKQTGHLWTFCIQYTSTAAFWITFSFNSFNWQWNDVKTMLKNQNLHVKTCFLLWLPGGVEQVGPCWSHSESKSGTEPEGDPKIKEHMLRFLTMLQQSTTAKGIQRLHISLLGQLTLFA